MLKQNDKKILTGAMVIMIAPFSFSQLKWIKVDSMYQPLPKSVHVYKTTDSLDGKPNIAFYVIADLKDKKLDFTADTTRDRRLTPIKFYETDNKPLLVVNCTFFSFATNQNLNVVIKNGKLLGYNIHSIAGKGKDTLTYQHPLGSAIGLTKKRTADVAWLYADSAIRYSYAQQFPLEAIKDSISYFDYSKADYLTSIVTHQGAVASLKRWKMKTAVGGGPVLLQNGEIRISNNEELKFAGKSINDKHPRTAMGYTKDNKLVILVIQGRFPGIAEGATLTHEAQIFKDLGCWEALNLDGGGSSCMLVNGRKPSNPLIERGKGRFRQYS